MATVTPKELAQEFETDPRTLRKFLRRNARDNGLETPGKGSRWAIERKDVKKLRKGFDAWIAANAEKATDES